MAVAAGQMAFVEWRRRVREQVWIHQPILNNLLRLPQSVVKNHENHEPAFMDLPLRPARARHRMKPSGKPFRSRVPMSFNLKENRMNWEKPQAVDMRWGFEITMYIANR
ncbi:MAG: pyrroloquinoline quinone precursor peptide PqqA [Noviherbaspirillum sp.]